MVPGESSCPGGSEYVCRVTDCRSWPSFHKKIAIIAVSKKLISLIFWNRTCPLKSLLPLFLLTDRIWSPSANFRRPKHGQNCPATNFCQKAVWSNMHNHHLTFYDPSQYLCCFQITAQRVRKFRFHWFPCPSAKEGSFSCTFNFDATDLPDS